MKAPLFLRAKHWHIFLPLMVIPFVTMIVFVIVLAANFMTSQSDGPRDMFHIFYLMPVFFMLCAGTQLFWTWSVAVNLRKYICSPDRKPRVKLFYLTFFLPIGYMCLMPFIMESYLSELIFNHEPNPAKIIPLMLLIFLGNLTMMFCFLNNNYVVTKTIKMAELQRKVTFSDFVGDFFFMLIFPVAIWFLQPRINKVVNGENENPSLSESKIQEDLLD